MEKSPKYAAYNSLLPKSDEYASTLRVGVSLKFRLARCPVCYHRHANIQPGELDMQ